MTIPFVAQHEFLPADNATLRRRLQSALGIEETASVVDAEVPGDRCGHSQSIDLRSGIRLVVTRRFRRVKTSSGFTKALTSIHMIAEDSPLHRTLFLRKERISLLGLERLVNAAVRTGLWRIAGYAGRVRSHDWGPDGMNYYIDLHEWNRNVDGDLQCERLTVRQEQT